MEDVTNKLVEQNEFIGYELCDEESQAFSEIDNLDSIEDLDLFDESKEEVRLEKQERTEDEKINDSFANHFGLGDAHESQKMKAKEQMKEYQLDKSRRESLLSNHAALDDFLKINNSNGK